MQNRQGGQQSVIQVLIVDDIPETRENIKKLLAFEEQEFKVVGSVGTGREAIKAATARMRRFNFIVSKKLKKFQYGQQIITR